MDGIKHSGLEDPYSIWAHRVIADMFERTRVDSLVTHVGHRQNTESVPQHMEPGHAVTGHEVWIELETPAAHISIEVDYNKPGELPEIPEMDGDGE